MTKLKIYLKYFNTFSQHHIPNYLLIIVTVTVKFYRISYFKINVKRLSPETQICKLSTNQVKRQTA